MSEQATENKPTVTLTRSYFGAAELEAGVQYFNDVQEANPELTVVSNFDVENEVPEGMGLTVFPITERTEVDGKRSTEVKKVMLAIVPDVLSVLSGEAGDKALEFAKDKLSTAFMDKLASSEKSETILTLPSSVADFISVRGRGNELTAYNAVAKHMVKALQGKGLKSITQTILRQCLESTAFATHQYETIPQDAWLTILDKLAEMATKEGKDTAIFAHWKETRDNTEMAEDNIDLDLSDFSL